ncbi:hypothetical protein ACSAZL_09530 [Methanosarcina sp. T3]|uniref:hypothetical protein n=1 Tax=Methanosarcina sp. T3 TaxID=3439062 RepID=UPI003F83A133
MVGRALSAGSDLVGQYRVGNVIKRGMDILNDRKEGMSPEWRRVNRTTSAWNVHPGKTWS